MSKKKLRKSKVIDQIRVGAAKISINLNVPYRSGDLKNSFQFTGSEKAIEIKTNLYYMPYTNEPWISPRWKGRQNPNEKWFEESAEFMAKIIARHLGGKYVKVK